MKNRIAILLCVCLLLGGCAPAASNGENVATQSAPTVPAGNVTATTIATVSSHPTALPTVSASVETAAATTVTTQPATVTSATTRPTSATSATTRPTTATSTTTRPTTATSATTRPTTATSATTRPTTVTSATTQPTTATSATINSTGGLPANEPSPSINDVLMFRKNLICIPTGSTKTPEIIYFGSGTLRWYISHPRSITVDQYGQLTPHYEGNYTVYVTDGVYTASADVFSVFAYYDFDTALRFDDREITMEVGHSTLIEAYGTLGYTSYRSSDASVVASSGRYITAVAPGTAIIHATNGGYHTVLIVNVVPASQQQVQLSLNKTQLDLHVGDTYQLEYSYNGTGTLQWDDSLSDVARVDENGNVTVIGAGSIDIYLTDGNIACKCRVNATVAPDTLVESLTFSTTDQPLYDGIVKHVGDYMTFAMDAKPYTASQDTYVTTSDSGIIRVSRETVGGRSGFRLDYRKAGTCVITICSGDDAIKKSYTVHVKENYDCYPGKEQLTPEEFAYYATQVAVENGMSNAILPTGYLVSWKTDSELTWTAARGTGEGMPHHWWSIGYRYYVVTYEGTDEDGRHIFYLRGA